MLVDKGNRVQLEYCGFSCSGEIVDKYKTPSGLEYYYVKLDESFKLNGINHRTVQCTELDIIEVI